MKKPLFFLLLFTMVFQLLLPSVIWAEGKKKVPQKAQKAQKAQKHSERGKKKPQPFVDRAFNSVGEKEVVDSLRFVFLIGAFMLVPVLLVLMTAFTRILIVLSFLKKALSAQEIPPSSMVFGLALLLAAVVMTPTGKKIYKDTIVPYQAGDLLPSEAMEKGLKPLRAFMLTHARDDDLYLFLKVQKQPVPESRNQVPTQVVLPAFVISELRRAFEMGVLLLLPFLLIDLMVSLGLYSLGLTTIPHHSLAFPLKVSLFVAVDGWNLVVMGLLKSFAL